MATVVGFEEWAFGHKQELVACRPVNFADLDLGVGLRWVLVDTYG